MRYRPSEGRERHGRGWGRCPGLRRRRGAGDPPGREHGQVLPLMALLVLVAGASVLLLGRLGALAVGRAQARTAADASALAGAAEGEDGARRLAEANGAEIGGYSTEGKDTEVLAFLPVGPGRRLDAVARARRAGRVRPGLGTGSAGGGVGREGLAPAMVAAIARAEQLLGEPVPVVSGHRSSAQQQRLWERRATNPYPVARPGTSMHERGLAIDVPSGFAARLARVAGDAGLCRPLPATDPIHFEVCRWNPRP